MNEIVNKIIDWGNRKGIIENGTVARQTEKLGEEVFELVRAIIDNDFDEFKNAIADCTVVLILLAKMNNIDFVENLEEVYEEINQREGVMKDGQFLREKKCLLVF